MPDVSTALRTAVRSRARGQCEYCLVPEALKAVNHEIDHVIAIKHGGVATRGNLALCCAVCNRYKGTDLASIDPETGELQRLFHPRRDQWPEHFELRDGVIAARTAVARVTVQLLQLNEPDRILEREMMIRAGLLTSHRDLG